MSKKNYKLSKEIKQVIDNGLWSYQIQLPENQTLERLDKLNEDILKREQEIQLPEQNKDAVLNKIIKQYDQFAKQKRQRKKLDNSERKKQRKKEWEELKSNSFVHLGEGVSNWLNYREENGENLVEMELPSIPNAIVLSKFLDLELNKIKWLAYHRKSSRINHYIDFTISKKSGGYRNLSKPKELLAKTQRIIKSQILDNITLGDSIFGFIPGKSHITNAYEHRKAEFLINVDIENFFPSINYLRVRALFRRFGYSGEISTVFALLTTKQDSKRKVIRKKKYFIYEPSRFLPQGACTSPTISNLILQNIDEELKKRSIQLGYKYTRYADDLTFSTIKPVKNIGAMNNAVHKTIEYRGFKLNPRKSKFLGKNKQQNVTGMVINSGKPNVPRVWRRNLRAALHQYQKLDDQEEKKDRYNHLLGSIQYLRTSHKKIAEGFWVDLQNSFNRD